MRHDSHSPSPLAQLYKLHCRQLSALQEWKTQLIDCTYFSCALQLTKKAAVTHGTAIVPFRSYRPEHKAEFCVQITRISSVSTIKLLETDLSLIDPRWGNSRINYSNEDKMKANLDNLRVCFFGKNSCYLLDVFRNPTRKLTEFCGIYHLRK